MTEQTKPSAAPLAVIPPERIAEAKSAADEAAARIVAWAEMTKAIVEVLALDTPEDEERAASVVRAIRTELRAADDRRKALSEPYRRLVTEIDATFRDPRKALEVLDRKLRDRLAEASAKRDQARREAERAAARAAEEAARALREASRARNEVEEREAAATADTAIAAADAAAEVSAELTKAKPAGVGVRYTYEAEVTDLGAVPRAFLTLDASRVKAYLRGFGPGEEPAPVPGITWTRKASTVVRGR